MALLQNPGRIYSVLKSMAIRTKANGFFYDDIDTILFSNFIHSPLIMRYLIVAACLVLLFFHLQVNAQYTVNGNAIKESCNCYRLTENSIGRSGSVWNNNRINLSQSFDFTFDVFLGCNDGGADGIAFVLQPISTSVGSTGGGMGYFGITPAVGVTLDTYQNASADNDPFYDHIAIQLNGNVNHASPNTLTPNTQISATNPNVEDCQNHLLKIVWDAPTTTMTVYFDGVLRLTTTRDFVNTVFGGNNQVFWGFTGATGGLSNLQRFCTSLLPKFFFLPAQKRCVGEPVTFNDSTITFGGIIKRYWNFGDGSPIDSVNMNPVHTYAVAGDYDVTLTILALDSCTAVFNQTVRVGSKPIANFNTIDSCVNMPIGFLNTSTTAVGTINTYFWDLDNNSLTATVANPVTTYSTAGVKNIKLLVKSLEGCVSDTLYKSIRIKERPVADFSFTDSLCLGSTFTFSDNSTLADGPVNGWVWFIDGIGSGQNTPTLNHTFTTPGIHTATLFTTGAGSANCLSAGITKNVFVVGKPVAVIRNATICQGRQLQFQDSSFTPDGLAITNWWWDLGNGQFSTQQNPQVLYTVPGPVTVKLVVRNSRNCVSDTLTITIMVGAKPIAKFGVGEALCNNNQVQFSDSSTLNNASVNSWEWITNNSIFSTQQNATGLFVPGANTVGLLVTGSNGCKSDTAFKSFVIKTKPQIAMSFKDACRQSSVQFTATETGTNIGISSWHWNFGDGVTLTGNPVSHTYSTNNNYTVSLYGISVLGCASDTIRDVITIYGTNAFAGNDIIAAANQPVQLNASGGLSYQWLPPVGLNANDIANPVATNATDRSYFLKAFTPEGCESFDTINIKIYKGPEIYVPSAFTPNGDSQNDILKALPVGISSFDYFILYNRYGQVIFRTNDYTKGWDGRVKGKEQDTGSFIWIAAATDFRGNKIVRKGTVLLIR
jgi:gliding motility-associated-like protein